MDELKTAEAPAPSARLLDRLRGAWRDVAGQFGASRGLEPHLPADDAEVLRAQMRECLAGKGGEVSARGRAAELGRSYLALNAEGRGRFLHILADEFGTDPAQVDAAVAVLRSAPDRSWRQDAERALREALESPRIKLLTQFNALPQGVKFLVDMRAELLARAKGDPPLAALEAELRELLAGWFDVGFLELQRITWHSPALILEKFAAYEAVHAVQSWQDLKNRLDSDRRFYAFFHPRMPDEPLIFVEVALVRGMTANISELLDESAPVGDPSRADTAIFYSITSAQRGLAGISFGNFLIKRVADRLGHEFPNLKNFATLSPIPGFRSWLDDKIAAGDALAGALAGRLPGKTPPAESLRPPLMRLCAAYLTSRHEHTRRALDPVAHFHLSNGARLEKLNWLADTSEKGLTQSAGMMANYLYRLDDIDDNHEAYAGQGRIAAASAVRALAKG